MEKILSLMKFALENKVTDLFISTNKIPSCRFGGKIIQIEFPEMEKDEIIDFRKNLIGEENERTYIEEQGFDKSFIYDQFNRFRLNFFETTNGPCFVARPIRLGASLNFEALGLSEKLKEISLLERGMVIVTGTTGSGKSTTLSAMIDYINTNCQKHIITLEDPIEYLHNDKNSLISQREIDNSGSGFKSALKNALRESPDIIMIGEIRDEETMNIAITAAQTGHLVFATMHTSNASSAVERMLGLCPIEMQEQTAINLSTVLEAVISQRLLPRASGEGLVPAQEILIGTGTVRKQIERNNIEGLEVAISLGRAFGMQSFNQALDKLVKENIITEEIALANTENPDELKLFFKNMGNENSEEEQAADSTQLSQLDILDIFSAAVKNGASDFVLTVNSPPILCKSGSFERLRYPALAQHDIQRLIYSVINKRQRVKFEETRELDFAMTAQLPTNGGKQPFIYQRFRLNAFFQRGCPGMVGRILNDKIPTPKDLNLPPILSKIMQYKQGIFLVTGPTGSGKSTTLASLLNEVNYLNKKHIVTIEDPIEYTYENENCIIEQREIGVDTISFANGLRAAMRQAPNIIMVGELRDTETISTAITAAETGHLVLATLHANDATQTVERVVDSFPAAQQNQIRMQFAASVTGIVAQRLIPKANGEGRVAAFEIMLGTPPIQSLIREGKVHQLMSAIETAGNIGMVSMRSSLEKLYQQGEISEENMNLYLGTK